MQNKKNTNKKSICGEKVGKSVLDDPEKMALILSGWMYYYKFEYRGCPCGYK